MDTKYASGLISMLATTSGLRESSGVASCRRKYAPSSQISVTATSSVRVSAEVMVHSLGCMSGSCFAST